MGLNNRNNIEASSHAVLALFFLACLLLICADSSSAASYCDSIITAAPSIICISDANDYLYSSSAAPNGFNQRWWVFPPGFVIPPQGISYNNFTGANGQANYKQADGSSAHVHWNQEAGTTSGVYTVYMGFYQKNSSNFLKCSSSMQVEVIAIPSNIVRIL